ncbi:hypothetical protein [Pedobacter sp. ASV28]|uniref:hypothetical protein n=1 Tax=Pedobacter sp. ASV28 TaxID=2795123 RepID=UPI0018ECE0E2|nr:hypothetical protein [Pedobacter sp. ASV28]
MSLKKKTKHFWPQNDEVRFDIKFKVENGAKVPDHFADTLKKAQELLNKVFYSKEFKEELYKQSYNDSAYSKSKKGCFETVYDSKNGRIAGKAVYDNLIANKNINLLITIKNNGDKKGTMGSSNACIDKITTYDYWLVEKEGLSQRLARHIAHEFTHIRGYRHDNKVDKAYKWGKKTNEDPAYGVGSIVGDILSAWSKKGLI